MSQWRVRRTIQLLKRIGVKCLFRHPRAPELHVRKQNQILLLTGQQDKKKKWILICIDTYSVFSLPAELNWKRSETNIILKIKILLKKWVFIESQSEGWGTHWGDSLQINSSEINFKRAAYTFWNVMLLSKYTFLFLLGCPRLLLLSDYNGKWNNCLIQYQWFIDNKSD